MLVLLLFTILITLGAFHAFLSLYASAVVRGATDEGARAGAPEFAGAADCAIAANRALSELLPGPLGGDVAVGCANTADRSVARGVGRIPSPIPLLMPDITIDVTAVVQKEPEYES